MHQRFLVAALLLALPAAAQAGDYTAAAAVSRPSDDDALARPLITGRHGVVTSLSPLSSMAGMKILLEGGNAFDAAVATAFAVGVTDPKDSTLGGQGFAMIYAAKDRQVRALNFYGKAPAGATIAALAHRSYLTGYLSTPVPGNLQGYQALHRAYGKLPWREVVQPAIDLAQNGFVLTDDFTGALGVLESRLNYPSTRQVFFPNGRMPKVGEVFRQPELARTLTRIAEEGADVFYKGKIAHRIADFYQANGGILTYADLASYEAKWVQPLSTTYRGYTVFTPPPNSSGIAVLMQLNLLEGYDLKKFTPNSAAYLHLIGEVQRLAISDRNRYVADPDFVAIPIQRLLSKEYAAERRKLISLDATMKTVGAPVETGPADHQNTTHLTVVDQDGNMVSLTQTLGSWFGSGVTAADTGVLFSNQLRHLHTDPASPSQLGPGRQPRSNQSPLIVLKDGLPVMALGTPGNDGIWQRLPQVLANIIDFGMDLQHAVAAPRMIYGGYQETGTAIPPIFAIEDRIPAATRDALKAQGYTLKLIPSDEGSVNGIARDPLTGFMTAGSDPRRWGIEDTWYGDAMSVYGIGW